MNLYALISREKDAKTNYQKIAADIEATVNSFSFDPKAEAKAIYECGEQETKERFLQITAAFTKILAYFHENHMTDDRNMAACHIASAIMRCPEMDEFVSKSNYEFDERVGTNIGVWERIHNEQLDYGGRVAIHMTHMHRTLQQRFASACFYYFDQEASDKQRKAVFYSSGHWLNDGLPFI